MNKNIKIKLFNYLSFIENNINWFIIRIVTDFTSAEKNRHLAKQSQLVIDRRKVSLYKRESHAAPKKRQFFVVKWGRFSAKGIFARCPIDKKNHKRIKSSKNTYSSLTGSGNSPFPVCPFDSCCANRNSSWGRRRLPRRIIESTKQKTFFILIS